MRVIHHVLIAVFACSFVGLNVQAASLAYIAGVDASAGALVLLDTSTGVANGGPIAIAPDPWAVAVHPDGVFAYISHLPPRPGEGQGQVSIVDTSRRAVVATIPVRGQPLATALSPDGRRLYVANEGEGTLTVVDTVRQSVVVVLPGGSGSALAVSPDGEVVYAATAVGLTVTKPGQNLVRKWILPGNFRGIAFSPDGARLYATEAVSLTSSNLLAISTASEKVVATLPLPGPAASVVVNAAGTKVYVAGNGSLFVVDPQRFSVEAAVPVGQGSRSIALTPDDQSILVLNAADATVSMVDVATASVTRTVSIPTGTFSTGAFIGPSLPPANGRVVVEFHHAALDHYFVTSLGNEIADLDAERLGGWRRTGQRFFAWRPDAAGAPGQPVCRFYGLPSAGLDSHFYSASPAECDEVSARFAAAWQRESDNVMRLAVPDMLGGACPSGTLPVYRLWNARVDSNHRYTTDRALRDRLAAQGYVAEGYGLSAVAMCAPRGD